MTTLRSTNAPLASVARSVTVTLPERTAPLAVRAVPVMRPLAALMLNPAGRPVAL